MCMALTATVATSSDGNVTTLVIDATALVLVMCVNVSYFLFLLAVCGLPDLTVLLSHSPMENRDKLNKGR